MNLRKRQPNGQTATVAPESTPVSHGDRAANLRARASEVRDEVAAQERALEERANEARALEAQARQHDVEQELVDKVAALRRQADELEAAAAGLDAQVEALDTEIFDAVLRVAHFAEQLAELDTRRRTLEERAAAAAQAGDTDALLEPEREIALLPTIEKRLREQADAVATDPAAANMRAAHLESIADYHRRHAVLLRRQAKTDPLAPAIEDPEYLPASDIERWGGRTSADFSGARAAALQAVQQTPDLSHQDRAAIATAFERERRAALQRQRLAHWTKPLDEISALVAGVRDVAVELAAPAAFAHLDGALEWGPDARDPKRLRHRTFLELRKKLADSISSYEEQMRQEALYHEEPSLASGQLAACVQLATSSQLRLLRDVDEAATRASAEIMNARRPIEAAAADGRL